MPHGRPRCSRVARCSCRRPGEPDPLLAGALRVSEALEGGATTLVGVWQKAPMQALARLHALAAADLVDDERLGRPRADADVVPRLELLVEVVTGKSERARHRAGRGRARRAADAGTVRYRRRARRTWRFAVGDDRQRVGSARSRSSRGVLDAPFRRLPGRRARIRVRHSRRSGRVADVELPSTAGRCEGGAFDRGSRLEIAFQQSESGRRSETGSARRPLARTPVTKRAGRVCVGGLGVLAMRYGCSPTQGAVVVVRSSQLRRPATLLPIQRL